MFFSRGLKQMEDSLLDSGSDPFVKPRPSLPRASTVWLGMWNFGDACEGSSAVLRSRQLGLGQSQRDPFWGRCTTHLRLYFSAQLGSKNQRRRDPCCSGLTLPVLVVLAASCGPDRSILPGNTVRTAQPSMLRDGRSQDTPTMMLKKQPG